MDIKRIPSLGFYTREETAIFDFCISENQLKEEIIKLIGNILESIYKPLPDSIEFWKKCNVKWAF
jgi:hypothetical protein